MDSLPVAFFLLFLAIQAVVNRRTYLAKTRLLAGVRSICWDDFMDYRAHENSIFIPGDYRLFYFITGERRPIGRLAFIYSFLWFAVTSNA